MKYIFSIFVLFFLMISNMSAQSDTSNSILNAFDFWVGDWEIYWMNPDSSYTYGSNTISKTIDGKVIQENFEDLESGFKGTSISVFSVADSTWRQAWADNAGGYLEFTGKVDGEKRVFQGAPRMRNDTLIVQRMVFYDIEENSFIWDWQLSNDNEKSWKSVWKIFYERNQEE